MPGIISLSGAQKIKGEFPQSESAVSYYLLADSGRKRNLEKFAFSIVFILSAFGSFFPDLGLFRSIPIAFFVLSGILLILLHRKLLKHANENFQKEKVFLTEENVIVQHALQERKVKGIPIAKFKGISRRKIPFFGEFAVLEYLDGEGIDTLKEPLYFPENLDSLEKGIGDLFEGLKKGKI